MGFVYLVQNQDLYKIGRTDQLIKRLKQLAPCSLVASMETDRSRDLEHEIHLAYRHRRIPQTEYFRLSEAEVCEVRSILGCKSGASASRIPQRPLVHLAQRFSIVVLALTLLLGLSGEDVANTADATESTFASIFKSTLVISLGMTAVVAPIYVVLKLVESVRGSFRSR